MLGVLSVLCVFFGLLFVFPEWFLGSLVGLNYEDELPVVVSGFLMYGFGLFGLFWVVFGVVFG